MNEGLDVNAADIQGFSPAHMAAQKNHVDVLVALTKTKPLRSPSGGVRAAVLDVNVEDKEGASPLHHAVAAGHLEAAVFLVDAGANVDAMDLFRRTPAWRATVDEEVKCTKNVDNYLVRTSSLTIVRGCWCGRRRIGGHFDLSFILARKSGGQGTVLKFFSFSSHEKLVFDAQCGEKSNAPPTPHK